ncbi:hypothetical protein ACFY7C_19540 [Streptomyces sp. NPDC012769]|uniref:hypothetical protein n=1 Tax=Streptomyces sp. NPDC012769 TaxID=3364848 RepID=UPI00369A460C
MRKTIVTIVAASAVSLFGANVASAEAPKDMPIPACKSATDTTQELCYWDAGEKGKSFISFDYGKGKVPVKGSTAAAWEDALHVAAEIDYRKHS